MELVQESKLIKKKNNEIYFTILIVLLWCNSILLDYVRGVLLRVPLLWYSADVLVPMITGTFFLLALKPILSRLRSTDLLMVMGVLVVYFSHWALYRANAPFYDVNMQSFLVSRLPLYFVGVAFFSEKQEERLDLLYKSSVVTIYVFTLYHLALHSLNAVAMSSGDMNSSYNLLPHACLVFYKMVQKPNPWNVSAFVMSCLMLFMLGSRGPVLCIIVFAAVVLIMGRNVNRTLMFGIIAVVALLFIFIDDLLYTVLIWAYKLADTFGLSTRVFDKYLTGNFTVSASRLEIQEQIMTALNKNPVFGLGIYGDRYVTGGHYAHNILIEILSQYGYFFGTILLGTLAVYIVRTYLFTGRSKDTVSTLVLMLLMGCNLKLMVSGSYLLEPFFYFLIGYCTAQLRAQKAMKREKIRTSSFLKVRRLM